MNSMIQRIAWTLAAVILVVSVDLIHAQIPPTLKSAKGEAYIPQPQVAKTAALGFDTLAADYYWLQAIQLVGGAVADPTQHGYTIGRLIDVVTQLNPYVEHPYRFAAIWMTATEEDVRFANQLMERAIELHPDDWRNHFYKGFNHFYYLQEYPEAADELEAASKLPGAPAYLKRLVPRLRSQGEGGLGVAAAMLQELHRNAPGERAKAEYAKALDEIETERRALKLDEAREEYKRRNGRDIERVEDLVAGPNPVLAKLPPELHGWEWILHETTGEIVSSYYKARYQVHQRYRPGQFTPGQSESAGEDAGSEEKGSRG